MEKQEDTEKQNDRITKFEKLFKRRKRNKNQLCWITYNPLSEYNFDIENAEEDVEWMIYEIKRLKEENERLKEFIDAIRVQMENELGLK
ncbi:MAG: hypothetical protein JW881_21495 [Spirochaetales bacterium]|nr:hypothetical protein [Spirochaetales bacterium]